MSHTRRAVLRVAATASALALAGCGDGDQSEPTPTPTPTPTPVETVAVTLFDSAFNPAELRIEPRTQVLWENSDNYAHTVTAASDNWSFDEEVPAGETTGYTFETEGLYDVYCRFHGNQDLTGMSMRIAVGDATIPEG